MRYSVEYINEGINKIEDFGNEEDSAQKADDFADSLPPEAEARVVVD